MNSFCNHIGRNEEITLGNSNCTLEIQRNSISFHSFRVIDAMQAIGRQPLQPSSPSSLMTLTVAAWKAGFWIEDLEEGFETP